MMKRMCGIMKQMCSMCHMHEENANYLFLNCDIARKIWDNCDNWIGNTSVRHCSIVNHFQSL